MDQEAEIESENINFEDDDELDELSLEQVIQCMEEAWLNEKFAPEILPHKIEIAEILLGQITYMEEKVQQLESTDFKKGIHQMEIDRLRFIVSSYLRLRLEKIETFSSHILQQEKQRSERKEDLYLSQNELQFAQDYEENLKNHFDSLMSFCPAVLEEDAQIIKPNIHSVVFLKSKKNVNGILVDDGNGESNDLIDLSQGSQILISYNSVANLVKNGDVHLL